MVVHRDRISIASQCTAMARPIPREAPVTMATGCLAEDIDEIDRKAIAYLSIDVAAMANFHNRYVVNRSLSISSDVLR